MLREEKTVYEELCNLIRKMPEKESAEIVRRLRASEDVSSIIRQVKTGCLLLQLALSPESRLRYSFPYVADMPSKLRSPDNPYVGSSIFEASYSSNPSPSPDQLSGQYKCVYMKPYHVAEVVDPRFSKIRASRWTAVTDDDNLFRNLLQAYILYEHTTYPYIHMDSFLDGMVSGDERFCSSLMVNAMMASACVSGNVLSLACRCQKRANLSASTATAVSLTVTSSGNRSPWDTSSSPKQGGYGSSKSSWRSRASHAQWLVCS